MFECGKNRWPLHDFPLKPIEYRPHVIRCKINNVPGRRHHAGAVLCIRFNAQAEFGPVFLFTVQKKPGQSCRLIQTADQHAGCKGIQCAGVPGLFDLQCFLDEGNNL